MAFDACSWLLFAAVLVNQAGRVMIPAVKTSVLVDPDFAPAFEQNVGAMLSGVSLVCLFGKLLGAAVTDKLGGWLVLIAVFVMWIIATVASVSTYNVQIFGGAWLLNSFAYTVTWGAAVQVVGAKYSDSERGAQLSKIASASRFGATFGNIIFGQLLTAGLHWRQALMPVVPLQASTLQAARRVAASVTYGCSLHHIGLQPPSHRVAVCCPSCRSLLPVVPLQAVLLLLPLPLPLPLTLTQAVLLLACAYYWSTSRAAAAPTKAKVS